MNMQNLIPRLDCGTLLHMVWNMGYYAFSVSSCLESKSCFPLCPPSRYSQSLFLTVPSVELFPSDSEIGFYLLLELEFAKPMSARVHEDYMILPNIYFLMLIIIRLECESPLSNYEIFTTKFSLCFSPIIFLFDTCAYHNTGTNTL